MTLKEGKSMNKLNIRKTYSEKRVNCILLAAYLSFILISRLFVHMNCPIYLLATGACVLVVISFILAPVIIRFFSNIFVDDKHHFGRISSLKLRLFFYCFPLFVLLAYYVAYYPGDFSPDSIDQYRQAITNQYNDWHPVLHTLFTFWLPLRFSGGWIGSVTLFQELVLAATLGYCFESIYKYAGKYYVIGTMIFILCAPHLRIVRHPWKDVSFAIGALLLMVFSLHIFMTKGAWIKKISHAIFFIVVFVFTTIVRHNAILFTAPLLLALFFQILRKRFLIITLAIIALFTVIKGPLYSVLQVKAPGRRQVETLGLPMTIIGAAVTYTPGILEKDILEFAYKIAPRHVWTTNYHLGDYNSVKWQPETNNDVIEEYGAKKILDMMVRCIKASPRASISNIVKLTEGIYAVTGIRNIFLFYGAATLLVVISILSKCHLNRLKDWRKLLFALPLFSYNFGSALLLTAFVDCPRFFYYTLLIVPVILIFFYRKEENSEVAMDAA